MRLDRKGGMTIAGIMFIYDMVIIGSIVSEIRNIEKLEKGSIYK